MAIPTKGDWSSGSEMHQFQLKKAVVQCIAFLG
jgi:hypothetical protein